MYSSNQFFAFFAQMTHHDLIQQLQFLTAENQILRSKLPPHLTFTPREKNLLLKFGIPLGGRIKKIISVVHYSTFRRWVRELHLPKPPAKKRGRPRIFSHHIRSLIVSMARKSQWGYAKILAELKKLKIAISKTSVKNILTEYGIPTSRIRSQDSFSDTLKRTFDTLFACDFFSQSVWTPLGKHTFYILFFINIKTRRVHLSAITEHPDEHWLLQQIQTLSQNTPPSGKTVLIRDRDSKFGKSFDQFFEQKGFRILKTPYRSPNMNPYAESFVATIRRECLDHFFILGKVHLEYLLKEFLHYYNTHRPHTSMNNDPLTPADYPPDGEIRSQPVLGGLHHHYYRA